MGPKGEPVDYTESEHGRGRGTYMLDRGIDYGLMRGVGWGIGITAATARKILTPAAFALGSRQGKYTWYPWPHGVALVFHERPEIARSAKRYPGVDDPGEGAIRRVWPEYFEGTVEAPPDRLRKGDRIKTVESLGKGLGKGVEMEVIRVTPSMIHTDKFRIPQWMYIERKVVKLGSSSRVAAAFLEEGTNFFSTHGIGDPVWVTVQEQKLAGHIRAVTHTNAKVRYAVACGVNIEPQWGGGHTTLHNLDSVIVTARKGVRVEWEADNYS